MLRKRSLLRLWTLFSVAWLLLFPDWPLQPWTIPLILSLFALPLHQSLWLALGIGALLDLLGSHQPFGIHALACCTVLLFHYRMRRHFFEDNLSTPFLLTSSFSALLSLFLFAFLPQSSPKGAAIITDLIVLPIADGAIAFLALTLPRLIQRGQPTDPAGDRPQ